MFGKLFNMMLWSWPQLLCKTAEQKQKVRFTTLGYTVEVLAGVASSAYVYYKLLNLGALPLLPSRYTPSTSLQRLRRELAEERGVTDH